MRILPAILALVLFAVPVAHAADAPKKDKNLEDSVNKALEFLKNTQAKDGKAATIQGYRVSNQVRLIVRDVKKLGDVLDQAIAAGANQINRISFDLANAETIKDEARKQAMANARRRAELGY